jgi:hypothetical protein
VEITQITTHETDALGRLIQQYKGKPNIEALISVKALRMQELENAFYAIKDRLNIATQVGVQLDRIGDIVGQPRNGITDDVIYRLFLNAKIGLNSSNGDAEKIISIWNLLSQSTQTQLIENFPAEISLLSNNKMDDAIVLLAYDLIQQVASAGVKIVLLGYYDPDAPFAFEGNDPTGKNKGFGDDLDPTVGGKFADVYF